MAWTSPTTRATGDLISASIWNTDVVNNLSFLHGRYTVGLTASAAFGASSRVVWSITHGMGSTPAWFMIGSSYIAAASTSSGQNELVSNTIYNVTSTLLEVVSQMPSGATASVGANPAPWIARLS